MTELTLCMAGAILLLVVACALLWAQIAWLKADIKHLNQREFEICCFCNKLAEGERPALPLAEVCYCGGEHHGMWAAAYHPFEKKK